MATNPALSAPRAVVRLGAAALGAPVLVAAALLLAACGSSTPVAARAGDIELIHPFVPAPASPAVGAFYVTIHNTGHHADTLVGASSSAAGSATMHTETALGDMETMTPVAAITIPAGGTVTLSPGHDHVMLEGLRTPVHQGQTVDIRLRFTRAGTISVAAPVTSLSSSLTSMGGM